MRSNVRRAHWSRSEHIVTWPIRGKMLACYLFSIKDNPALTFLAHGPKVWLEELLPKYALFYPVQTACIQGAIKFLPKLDRAHMRWRSGRYLYSACALILILQE